MILERILSIRLGGTIIEVRRASAIQEASSRELAAMDALRFEPLRLPRGGRWRGELIADPFISGAFAFISGAFAFSSKTFAVLQGVRGLPISCASDRVLACGCAVTVVMHPPGLA